MYCISFIKRQQSLFCNFTIMKKFIIKSLVAMLISWIIACVILVISEGTGSGLSGIGGFFLMGLMFVVIAWLIFILPFIKIIKRLMENDKLKFVFPIFTSIYGFLAFVLIFSVFTGFSEFITFLTQPTTISVAAAGVGLLWGLIFVLITQNSDKKEVAL